MKDLDGKNIKDKFIACGKGKKKFDIEQPLQDRPRVKGKRLDLSIVEEVDGFNYIYWKRKKYQVNILEKNQNKYTVMINGVWYTFSIETPISYKRRKYLSKMGDSSRIEKVSAPMPGKILDIMVEENTEIKQGDPIVILEAMKMQNEIISTVNGRVKKINIKANDSVMKDDVILEIEKV